MFLKFFLRWLLSVFVLGFVLLGLAHVWHLDIVMQLTRLLSSGKGSPARKNLKMPGSDPCGGPAAPESSQKASRKPGSLVIVYSNAINCLAGLPVHWNLLLSSGIP